MCASPLVRCSNDGTAWDEEREMMKTRLAARVGGRLLCLVEEQLCTLPTVGSVVERPSEARVELTKNVLATGVCSIETRGRVLELVEPELVTDPELRPAPPHVRFVERRIAGVTQYCACARPRLPRSEIERAVRASPAST